MTTKSKKKLREIVVIDQRERVDINNMPPELKERWDRFWNNLLSDK